MKVNHHSNFTFLVHPNKELKVHLDHIFMKNIDTKLIVSSI